MPPDDPHDLHPVFLDLGTVGIFRDVVWGSEYQLGKVMGLLGNKPVNHRPPQDAVLPKLIGRGVFTVDDVLTEMDKLLTQVGIFHHEDFRKVTPSQGDRGHPGHHYEVSSMVGAGDVLARARIMRVHIRAHEKPCDVAVRMASSEAHKSLSDRRNDCRLAVT